MQATAQDLQANPDSNFGRILPQQGFNQGPFYAPTPFTDALNQDPQASFTSPDYQSTKENSSLPETVVPGLDKPKAWYKFLEPSLNLSRTLAESERKRLLSIVPVPLNLRPPTQKQEGRTVLLQAEQKNDYYCFKTIYGSLFARNQALLLVSSHKLVRILNISGKERDVLFKLANGQVITIGPGSEMVIGKTLTLQEMNWQDGVARRGITAPMKCSELQMGFTQFSYASILALPELKFFCKNQSSEYMQNLTALVDKINEIRGTSGFRTAMQENLARTTKKAAETKAELARATNAPTAGNKPGLAERNTKSEDFQKTQKEQKELKAAKTLKASGQSAQPPEKIQKTASALAAKARECGSNTSKQSRSASKLGSIFKASKQENKSEPARQIGEQESRESKDAHAKDPGLQAEWAEKKTHSHASDESISSSGKKTESSKRAWTTRLNKNLSNKIKDSLNAKIAEAKSLKVETRAPVTPPKRNSALAEKEVKPAPETARKLLPRKLPGPDTPPDIAKLLLEADKEEKLSLNLRKKADKCIAFMEGGLMNPDQQKRMMIQAKQHLKLASEAEERAQALRRQVEIAETGRNSI